MSTATCEKRQEASDACSTPIDLAPVIRHRDDCRWIEELIEYGINLGEEARTRD